MSGGHAAGRQHKGAPFPIAAPPRNGHWAVWAGHRAGTRAVRERTMLSDLLQQLSLRSRPVGAAVGVAVGGRRTERDEAQLRQRQIGVLRQSLRLQLHHGTAATVETSTPPCALGPAQPLDGMACAATLANSECSHGSSSSGRPRTDGKAACVLAWGRRGAGSRSPGQRGRAGVEGGRGHEDCYIYTGCVLTQTNMMYKIIVI